MVLLPGSYYSAYVCSRRDGNYASVFVKLCA